MLPFSGPAAFETLSGAGHDGGFFILPDRQFSDRNRNSDAINRHRVSSSHCQTPLTDGLSPDPIVHRDPGGDIP